MKDYITTSIAAIFLFGIICIAGAKEKIPEAMPISATVQQVMPIEKAEEASVLVKSYGTVPYAEFINLVVEAIEKGASIKAIVSAVLPIVQRCDTSDAIEMIADICSKIDHAKSMQLLADISKSVEKTTFIDVIISLIKKTAYVDPVNLLEWYQLVPFDSGTGLWAIAQKAKKYAEDGNAKRLADMLELYNETLKDYKQKQER